MEWGKRDGGFGICAWAVSMCANVNSGDGLDARCLRVHPPSTGGLGEVSHRWYTLHVTCRILCSQREGVCYLLSGELDFVS
jgi:hypothetical protein